MVPVSCSTLRKIFTVIALALPVGLVATAQDLPKKVAAYHRPDDTGDRNMAPGHLRRLALQGDAGAQHDLGYLYLRGKGVPQDEAAAVTWFRKAADQGHTEARDNLAFMSMRGEGTRRADAAPAGSLVDAAAPQPVTTVTKILEMVEPREVTAKASPVATEKAVVAESRETVKAPEPAAKKPVAVAAVGKAVAVKPANSKTVPKAPTEKRVDTAAPAAPALAPEEFRIQLGSIKEKGRAVAEAQRLNRLHGTVLGGLTVVPVRASVGTRGVFYRLRAGPISGFTAAKTLCRELSARKQRCMVARH